MEPSTILAGVELDDALAALRHLLTTEGSVEDLVEVFGRYGVVPGRGDSGWEAQFMCDACFLDYSLNYRYSYDEWNAEAAPGVYGSMCKGCQDRMA